MYTRLRSRLLKEIAGKLRLKSRKRVLKIIGSGEPYAVKIARTVRGRVRTYPTNSRDIIHNSTNMK